MNACECGSTKRPVEKCRLCGNDYGLSGDGPNGEYNYRCVSCGAAGEWEDRCPDCGELREDNTQE